MISFDKTNHEYSMDGERYQNVSSIVNKYIPPFPKGLIAAKIAKRDGITEEEVLEQWDMKREVSTLYGEAIHLGVELYIKYGELPKSTHIKEAVEAVAKVIDRKRTVTEMIVKDDELKIAGRTDILEKLGNNQVILDDIKTNYDLTDGKGYMLPPFDKLKNNNLNKYRLQQSVYKFLLERRGLTVTKMRLFHWNTGLEIIEIEPLAVEKILT